MCLLRIECAKYNMIGFALYCALTFCQSRRQSLSPPPTPSSSSSVFPFHLVEQPFDSRREPGTALLHGRRDFFVMPKITIHQPGEIKVVPFLDAITNQLCLLADVRRSRFILSQNEIYHSAILDYTIGVRANHNNRSLCASVYIAHRVQ